MRVALLGCCLLAALLAPASPAAAPGVGQAGYDKLETEVRQQRWRSQPGAPPSDAELRLATLSAALLTQLKDQPDSWLTTQRRVQLQQNAVRVSLGKVELDGMLSVGGQLRQDKVDEAFRQYLREQRAMADALGLDSAAQLWWSPFVTSSGDARSALQTAWSQVGPVVSALVSHLRQLPADGRLSELMYACAARDECSELVKLALPYPDVSNVASDLLHEKALTTEQLARLAEQFLTLLGLPAAPAEFWADSQFSAPSPDCADYVDAEKARLCADADAAGLKSALELMTDAEYLRTAAGQPAPFQTPAFPGFERAVSSCVSLLSVQPSVVQQLVYGYSAEAAGPARLAPVSLYLARGGRPAGQKDARCAGDIGCQQTANALMEAAVTQLLPLGYHMASLRWLEALEAAPEADAAAAWQTELRHTLGESAATSSTPDQLDSHFYDAGGHISRLLAGMAAFQLRAAACPSAGECLPTGADAAGKILSKVMASGSSQPWDRLLSDVTGRAAGAEALVAFFEPLRELSADATETHKLMRTLELLELEDDAGSSHSAAGLSDSAAPSHCEMVQNQTAQEEALCLWNDEHDEGYRRNVTDAEWELALDTTATENADQLVESRKQFLQKRNTARSALTPDPNEWVSNSTDLDEDEAALWGEMFILSEKDPGLASDANLQKLLESTVELLKTYTGVAICPYSKQSCEDSEKMTIWDLQAAMAAGGMEEQEVQYYWRQYRDVAKVEMRTAFGDYVASGKAAAQDAGLNHYGQFWLEPYGYGSDDESLLEEMAATWAGLDALYRSLHAVVRYRLDTAGISSVGSTQPLPSHLLGDMFGADWRNIYNDTRPFDNYTIDIGSKLEDKKYDIVKIRDDAVAYLRLIGLADLSAASCFSTDSNWEPCAKGQDCDALAWTSGDSDCVKIRATGEVTMDNYERVHAKAAELAYYLAYKDLDPEYRAPANPAFTEAVAGAVTLSVLTPGHLKTKGLQPMDDDSDFDELYDIDFLYRRALQHLAPLPFNYVTNKWLWELFKDGIDRWEHRWWELREEIQGVRPSETRGNDDEDMLGVPDLARDRPAFQRYMATLLQFQLFEKLCIDAGEFDLMDPEAQPLHRCDLTNKASKLDALTELVEAGNTMRWRELLVNHTVNGTLAADSMIRYFEPLNVHLQSVISTNNLATHWDSNLADYWDEEIDNTVPIVVGVVLGVLVLIVVIAYFVSRARRNKEE